MNASRRCIPQWKDSFDSSESSCLLSQWHPLLPLAAPPGHSLWLDKLLTHLSISSIGIDKGVGEDASRWRRTHVWLSKKCMHMQIWSDLMPISENFSHCIGEGRRISMIPYSSLAYYYHWCQWNDVIRNFTHNSMFLLTKRPLIRDIAAVTQFLCEWTETEVSTMHSELLCLFVALLPGQSQPERIWVSLRRTQQLSICKQQPQYQSLLIIPGWMDKWHHFNVLEVMFITSVFQRLYPKNN